MLALLEALKQQNAKVSAPTAITTATTASSGVDPSREESSVPTCSATTCVHTPVFTPREKDGPNCWPAGRPGLDFLWLITSGMRFQQLGQELEQFFAHAAMSRIGLPSQPARGLFRPWTTVPRVHRSGEGRKSTICVCVCL